MSRSSAAARRGTAVPLAVAILAAGVGSATAQQDSKDLQRDFDALPLAKQHAVLAAVESQLQKSTDAGLQRIRDLAKEIRDPAPLRPRTFHDPAVFAPVANKRVVIAVDDPAHARAGSDFPPVRPLRDLVPATIYDWCHGTPARVLRPPTPAQRFANFLAGYHPDADAAMAAVLVWLDRDGDQRTFAAWCGQLYADRDGKVFEEITLYDAWYTGRPVEVPDVDAIAFARQILGTQSFLSPIPDGARRDRLYAEIRQAFARHRSYRTLCEAAAAAFVTASPELDPTYLPLIDRMHLLWAQCDYDVARFASRLTSMERGELLEKLDRLLVENPDAATLVADAKTAMKSLAELVRTAAISALRDN